jgi:hypothetical protein
MHFDVTSALAIFALNLPLVAIVVILAHYMLRRAAWRRSRRLGRRRLGYYPSSFALGMALQFIQVFHRPSMAYVLEAKQDEEADADDSGGPESLARQLHRQLRRIRHGEFVERLVLRL